MKRRQHTPAEKAQLVLDAFRKERTFSRHMREMGISALYPAPDTSKSASGHRLLT